MEPLMALAIGLLYATAIFMMLRRSIVKLVIGLMLLSNAANLLIFTTAGMTRGAPPLIPEGMMQPLGGTVDEGGRAGWRMMRVYASCGRGVCTYP